MTHLLTSALNQHDRDWLRSNVGLERSYVRRSGDDVYAVIVDNSGLVAVYRRKDGKRGIVVEQVSTWPPNVTDPLGDD